MSRANLIHEINDLLQREYGVDWTIADPINVRDLAIIVLGAEAGESQGQVVKL